MQKELFILLILITTLFSICPTGVRQIEVPAVVGGDDGGSLAIQIQIAPGDGNIYTSIYPKTGISTQSSEESAVLSAFITSNKSLDECVVHFDVINTLNSKYVDGPSAGAAMAVASSAILQNMKLREDIVITGTINSNGEIGTVGGITEKVIAASKSGKSYFLTPIPSVRNRIIAAALEDIEDIKLIDVRTLEQANEIFFKTEGTEIQIEKKPLENTILSDELITIEKNKELETFAQIGYNMKDNFKSTLDNYLEKIGNDSSRAEFIYYFEEEIEIQEELLDRGYVFTAANNMFLQEIDYEFLTKVGNIDLEKEKQEAQLCFDELMLKEKKQDNWQWITGSEMRLNWAEDKLDNLPLFSDKATEGSEYPYLYEILYAKSWCNIARNLNKEGTGKIIDESNLEKFAKDKILLEQEFISRQPEINSEALRHLRTAQIALDKGQYISAIYDSSFARALQESTSDIFYEKNIEALTDELYKQSNNKTSLWGQLYLTQAKYIYLTEEKENAYTIFLLSNEFEEITNEIQKELLTNQTNSEIIEEKQTDKTDKIITFLSVFIVLESILLLYIIYACKKLR